MRCETTPLVQGEAINSKVINSNVNPFGYVTYFPQLHLSLLSPDSFFSSGDLICGVVNETIPFHAAVGASINDTTQLMIQCPVNAVLISKRAKNDLPNRLGLKKFNNQVV